MNNWITPNWPATSNIQAFFTTRQGGFSRDLYAGFNLGDHVGDNPLLVQKIAQNCVTLYQENLDG